MFFVVVFVLALVIAVAVGITRAVQLELAKSPRRPAVAAKLTCGGIRVAGGTVSHNGVSFPLAGASAELETVGTVNRRITATRVVALGVLAAAVPKKQDDRDFYVTVRSAEGGMVQAKVSREQEQGARSFVVAVNNLAARA